MIRISLALIFLLSFSLSAFAEVYKWVDDEGKIHYSQTPPEGRESIAIKPDTTPGKPLTRDFSVDQTDVKGEVDVKDVKDDSGEVTVIDTDKLKAYCDGQRKTLSVLKNTKRISVMDDGVSSNISNAEKQKKIENIQNNLQKYCQ